MKQPQRTRLTSTRLSDFGTRQHEQRDLSLLETQKQVAVKHEVPMTDVQTVWKSNGGFISIPSRSPLSDFSNSRSFPDVPDRTPPTAWLYPAEESGAFPVASIMEAMQQEAIQQGVMNYAPTEKAKSGKQGKKVLGLALRVGGTILLTWMLLKSFSWASLLEALGHMQPGNLLVALLVGIIGVVLSCYQWRSVLHAEHIRYDLAELIDLYVVGIAFSHFLPTGMGGDAIKAVRVGQESGNSAGSASAVVMCRVTGFFAMVLIAIPVLLLWHDTLDGQLILWFAALALLVGTMIGVALLCAILLPRLGVQAGRSPRAGKWLKRVVEHRIFASALKIGNALYASLKKKRAVLVATLYGALFWVSAVLNCYSYADAIGIHAPLHFYFLVVPFISLIA
ncbi:MAG TPA: hypothetical protein DHW02_19835, partial [Ktedonobacter sp.]|nr:hypothetical protein [Ktedonobacter sp.]